MEGDHSIQFCAYHVCFDFVVVVSILDSLILRSHSLIYARAFTVSNGAIVEQNLNLWYVYLNVSDSLVVVLHVVY